MTKESAGRIRIGAIAIVGALVFATLAMRASRSIAAVHPSRANDSAKQPSSRAMASLTSPLGPLSINGEGMETGQRL